VCGAPYFRVWGVVCVGGFWVCAFVVVVFFVVLGGFGVWGCFWALLVLGLLGVFHRLGGL
jgi:hypothetical protein